MLYRQVVAKNVFLLKIHVALTFLLFSFFSGCAIFHEQQGQYINHDVSLHYTSKGEGEPVILIHGILANADLNWRFPRITHKLSKNFYVIAFDLRGHGKSDKPHGKEMYGMNLVNDVCRIMDNLHIDKAHIVGYSLGGFIALKFATCYPERAYSVTVAGAGWEKPTEENMERLRKIYTAMRTDKDCTPLFELVGMKKQGFERVMIAIGNWYFRQKNDLNVIADLLESSPQLEVKEEDLRNCHVPILLIGGTADPMCKTIPELSTVLPDCEVVWINKGTHLTTLFKKDFVNSIEKFLLSHKKS